MYEVDQVLVMVVGKRALILIVEGLANQKKSGRKIMGDDRNGELG